MSRWNVDSITRWILLSALAVSAGVMGWMVWFLLAESGVALRHIGLFRWFTDVSWHPASGEDSGQFNLSPMMWGTFWVTSGAVALAVPVAWLSCVFVNFTMNQRLAQGFRHVLALLAGIPSVVYGLWGMTTLVPLIRRLEPPGASLLAGIVVLAIMILPTIALLTDAAFRAVPTSVIDSAASSGLSRWGTLRAAILPTAKPGIAAAVVLGTGRAMGETMAVLMVCGNVVQRPSSVLEPVRTLTANIALEMAYAMDLHRSALFVTGLVLAAMIGGLVVWAHLLREVRLYVPV